MEDEEEGEESVEVDVEAVPPLHVATGGWLHDQEPIGHEPDQWGYY